MVDKAYKTMANMRREDDEQKRVHLRHTLKKTIDLMKGRNRYFAKYTKMVDIQPAAGEAKPTSNTTSQDAIDSRPSRLPSEGGNGTGSNTYQASVQFQDFKSADQQRPAITKYTIHPSIYTPSFRLTHVLRIAPPQRRVAHIVRIAPPQRLTHIFRRGTPTRAHREDAMHESQDN